MLNSILTMKTIMVVDDNPDIIFAIKKGLEALKEDYEIIGANGGKECLSLLQSKKPDLILLDIMMPEMDGWEVVARVRANSDYKKIPIVFLTAKDDAITKGMASLGVDGYITKPVAIEILNQKIKELSKSTK